MDKVQKIREEVEKLKLCTMDEHMKFYSDAAEAEYNALCNIEHFIDSLQEEPVSNELEEASKNYALNNTPWDDCKDEIQESFKAGAKWQKAKDESTTEDLGEYINELSKQFPEVSFAKLSRIAVRVAKWQKQQDQSTIELAEDHAYFAGRTKTIGEINEALLSEVLPCFMHGGEADEVVAKLDEVLNQKK